jgi:hypothetical protein
MYASRRCSSLARHVVSLIQLVKPKGRAHQQLFVTRQTPYMVRLYHASPSPLLKPSLIKSLYLESSIDRRAEVVFDPVLDDFRAVGENNRDSDRSFPMRASIRIYQPRGTRHRSHNLSKLGGPLLGVHHIMHSRRTLAVLEAFPIKKWAEFCRRDRFPIRGPQGRQSVQFGHLR